MNESEIANFMKESNRKRLEKEHIDKIMSNFKDSDFNPDIKSTCMIEKNQGIGWIFAEKKSECYFCGIATDMYRLVNDCKQFACSSCWVNVKK